MWQINVKLLSKKFCVCPGSKQEERNRRTGKIQRQNVKTEKRKIKCNKLLCTESIDVIRKWQEGF